MATRIPLLGFLSRPARGELATLLATADPSPGAMGQLLDGMSHGQRLESTRALSPREQAKLYRVVDAAHPFGLDDLVPPETPALTPVRYYGRNTLPAFRLFEKRFYRTRSGGLSGANFSPTAPVAGPGYFCMTALPERGEVDIDYTRVPSEADGKPAGWPAIRDNDHGTRKLVFGGMIDNLRRVSSHVYIGSAARHGKPLGAYFVLCREPYA